MVWVQVEVHLKKGVTDPEGDNVQKALRLLGFSQVRKVQSAKLFLIDVGARSEKAAADQVEEMCRKLLANPVIHDYRITVEHSETQGRA